MLLWMSERGQDDERCGSMGGGLCAGVLACLLMSACSLVFVQEPTDAMLTKRAPMTCTTSRTLPITDFVIGAVLGSAVFGTTYAAVDRFNDECSPERCYRPWGPALIAAFLTVSPSWMSSAIGFSDTHQCREAVRAQGSEPSRD